MSLPRLARLHACWWLSAVGLLGCAKGSSEQCAGLANEQLAFFQGSRLGAHGVSAGKPVRCEASSLGPVFARALAEVPSTLRPRVTVHVDVTTTEGATAPRLVQYHSPSSSLIVGPDAADDLTTSVALHEIAHVALDGPRPGSLLAQRLHRAVNEAVADYWAATFGDDARLGSEALGEVRDLSNPPALRRSEWARLALPHPFPAHRFAHSLASLWWKQAPGDETFLADLVTMLAKPDPFEPSADTPTRMVAALASRCPPRSRHRLLSSLTIWLPPELVES